jgi:hypothetical protein
MHFTLLAVVLLNAGPPDDDEQLPPARPPPGSQVARRADLVMQAAVEDFVRTAVPKSRPPQPFRSMIDQVGGDCYGCRNRAAKRLRAASAADPRWLFWGRHHRDPEIRLRCNNMLRAMTRCQYCDGTGLCRQYRPDPPEGQGPCQTCGRFAWGHPEYAAECWPCGGLGFGWVKGAFE